MRTNEIVRLIDGGGQAGLVGSTISISDTVLKPPFSFHCQSQQGKFPLRLKFSGSLETLIDKMQSRQYDSQPLEVLPGIREGFTVLIHADVAAKRPPT